MTPREKMDAVLEASEFIYAAPILNGYDRPVSADEYLPILVYILLRANPPELQSNIDYISSFRGRRRMIGEGAYFFTHLSGAVYFIETLDASMLSIEPYLFDRLISDDDENIYGSFVSNDSSPVVPARTHSIRHSSSLWQGSLRDVAGLRGGVGARGGGLEDEDDSASPLQRHGHLAHASPIVSRGVKGHVASPLGMPGEEPEGLPLSEGPAQMAASTPVRISGGAKLSPPKVCAGTGHPLCKALSSILRKSCAPNKLPSPICALRYIALSLQPPAHQSLLQHSYCPPSNSDPSTEPCRHSCIADKHLVSTVFGTKRPIQ